MTTYETIKVRTGYMGYNFNDSNQKISQLIRKVIQDEPPQNILADLCCLLVII